VTLAKTHPQLRQDAGRLLAGCPMVVGASDTVSPCRAASRKRGAGETNTLLSVKRSNEKTRSENALVRARKMCREFLVLHTISSGT
jgi:hypothetical protein